MRKWANGKLIREDLRPWHEVKNENAKNWRRARKERNEAEKQSSVITPEKVIKEPTKVPENTDVQKGSSQVSTNNELPKNTLVSVLLPSSIGALKSIAKSGGRFLRPHILSAIHNLRKFLDEEDPKIRL